MPCTLSHTASQTLLALVALSLAVTRPAAAQTAAPQPHRWEVRVTGGRLLPTGEQRRNVGTADLTAAQVAWLLRPSVAITGTFGWARSRDVALIGAPKLDAFASDLGVELRGKPWFAGRSATFSPFMGAGAGARSYNYRSLDVAATHSVAAYAAMGGEAGVGRLGVRLEVRDYASGFRPLSGNGSSDARNDVVVMAALRFNRHAGAQR